MWVINITVNFSLQQNSHVEACLPWLTKLKQNIEMKIVGYAY